MFSIRVYLILGLSALFVGCSTGRFGETYQLPNETKSHRAFRYLVGRGVPEDKSKSFQMFKEAATEGDPFAQNELAYLYASGKGTEKDMEKAFNWYKRAAGHGLASAEYNLGLLYLHGLGTEQNKSLAKEWIEKAAQKNFEPAKITLEKEFS